MFLGNGAVPPANAGQEGYTTSVDISVSTLWPGIDLSDALLAVERILNVKAQPLEPLSNTSSASTVPDAIAWHEQAQSASGRQLMTIIGPETSQIADRVSWTRSVARALQALPDNQFPDKALFVWRVDDFMETEHRGADGLASAELTQLVSEVFRCWPRCEIIISGAALLAIPREWQAPISDDLRALTAVQLGVRLGFTRSDLIAAESLLIRQQTLIPFIPRLRTTIVERTTRLGQPDNRNWARRMLAIAFLADGNTLAAAALVTQLRKLGDSWWRSAQIKRSTRRQIRTFRRLPILRALATRAAEHDSALRLDPVSGGSQSDSKIRLLTNTNGANGNTTDRAAGIRSWKPHQPRFVNPALVQTLVFSKDRPLQLDAMLRSFRNMCEDSEHSLVSVLFHASDSRTRALYRRLQKEHPDVSLFEQTDFRADTLAILRLGTHVLFVVDDCIFTRSFRLREAVDALATSSEAIGVSLRLGRNVTYCYMSDQPQSVPPLTDAGFGFVSFQWTEAEHDFGYPLELSSSVYRVADLLPTLETLPFKNPNTLEAGLASVARSQFGQKDRLLCLEESVAFCNPLNLVQDVCENRSGRDESYSPKALLDAYAEGRRVDVARLAGLIPTSCHQEVPLSLSLAAPQVPTVTVVMPCYNQSAFLDDAVNSVLRQTFLDWELVIVNDGSTDDSRAEAQRLVSDNPERNIRLLDLKNGGVARARNEGILCAEGAYILPLDADDMIHPEMLAKSVQLLDSHPEVSIAYSDIEHFGARSLRIQASDFDAKALPQDNQLNCCSLFRREMFDATGGYKPIYWGYEDWDFWVSCVAGGFLAKRIPEPLFLYRVKDVSRDTVAVTRDAQLRDRIVLNHPELYPSERVQAARRTAGTLDEPQNAQDPQVSVIIPTFNRPDTLLTAVSSVVSQTFTDLEVIVVNNGGLDIRSWIRREFQDDRIRVISLPQRLTAGAARNRGIRIARGNSILFLDDDDVLYQHHLERLKAEAIRTKKRVTHCDVLMRWKFPRVAEQTSFTFSHELNLDQLLVHNLFPIHSVLIQKSCLDEVGGFDESLMTHEDWDLWIRVALRFGWQRVPEVLCEYVRDATRTSLTSTERLDFFKTMSLVQSRYLHAASDRVRIRRLQRATLQNKALELLSTFQLLPPLTTLRLGPRYTLRSLLTAARCLFVRDKWPA